MSPSSWWGSGSCWLISHWMKTFSRSHGSSLTRGLPGDAGTFAGASDVLRYPEEWGVPLCLGPRLLGDDGRDGSLWKEMRSDGRS